MLLRWHRIVLSLLALFALALFIATLVLPFAGDVLVLGNVPMPFVVSVWGLSAMASIIASLLLAVLALMPLLHPRRRIWLFPLTGAILVLAVAVLGLILSFAQIDSGGVPITFCILGVAGFLLFAETLMTRHVVHS